MIYAIAITSAMLMVALQGSLTRALSKADTGAKRGLLLGIKLPLWVGFFIALTLGGTACLLTGGAVASAGYLALGMWWMIRSRREEENA